MRLRFVYALLAVTALLFVWITLSWHTTGSSLENATHTASSTEPDSTDASQVKANTRFASVAEMRPPREENHYMRGSSVFRNVGEASNHIDPCEGVTTFIRADHFGGLNNIRARIINQVIAASWFNAGIELPTVTAHSFTGRNAVSHDEHKPFSDLFDEDFFVQELTAAGFCVVKKAPVSSDSRCSRLMKWGTTDSGGDSDLAYFHGDPEADGKKFREIFQNKWGVYTTFPSDCPENDRTMVHSTRSPLFTVLTYSVPSVCMNYGECQLVLRALRPNPSGAQVVHLIKQYLAKQPAPLVVLHVRTWFCSPFTVEMAQSILDVMRDSLIPQGATLYLASESLGDDVMRLLESQFIVLTKARVAKILGITDTIATLPYQLQAFIDYEIGLASDFFVGSTESMNNVIRGYGGSSFDNYLYVERMMAGRPYIPYVRAELHMGKGDKCSFSSPLKPFLENKFAGRDKLWRFNSDMLREQNKIRAEYIDNAYRIFDREP